MSEYIRIAGSSSRHHKVSSSLQPNVGTTPLTMKTFILLVAAVACHASVLPYNVVPSAPAILHADSLSPPVMRILVPGIRFNVPAPVTYSRQVVVPAPAPVIAGAPAPAPVVSYSDPVAAPVLSAAPAPAPVLPAVPAPAPVVSYSDPVAAPVLSAAPAPAPVLPAVPAPAPVVSYSDPVAAPVLSAAPAPAPVLPAVAAPAPVVSYSAPVSAPVPAIPAAPVAIAAAPEPLEAPEPPMPSIGEPFVGGQFHAQDEAGQYSFGHWGGPNTRVETRDHLGRTTGSFAYIDPVGDVQVRKYAAGPGSGFKVAASDLP
ncbi:skin secretory protein xP2-like [Palaemon carinicauda]|uniref:skin secretory protein xP2-like n=1 Tax=Palaemon carinicauda TaxID=392227 RepID=UPI0035B62F6E